MPFIRCANATASFDGSATAADSSSGCATLESGKTLNAMCRIWSTAFGATACATSPKVPRRVLISFGLLRRPSQIMSAASSALISGNASYILVGAVIAVRTNGMWMVVKVMPWPITSLATQVVNPVSYTHLRAHETPEHLVFRLLLEKNN